MYNINNTDIFYHYKRDEIIFISLLHYNYL